MCFSHTDADVQFTLDAYDDIEMSMGWYYTFDECLSFPFTATAQLKKKDGSIETKRVKIVGLHSKEKDFTEKDFQLEMEHGSYVMPIEYSKLSKIEADEETMEMFEIWDFWVNKY
ncbi:MAG: calcium-binding protein [Spirosomaceae bacterium]|nr:calcium-binding protein [Spirosomataceae bacterium]